MRNEKFRLNGLVAWLFVVLIAAPLLGTFFGWDFYPAEDENRRMAEFPEFESLPLAVWPGKIEAYYKDHFGFRNTFIRRQRKMMEEVFGRTSDRALEGLNGWLYLKDNGNISDFIGLRKLSDEQMEELRVSFEGRQRWLAQQGVRYLFVIPPNKPVVYPEYLPEDIQADRATDGIIQWKNYLTENRSSLNILDLRDELLLHKADGVLYFSNDTHWTYLGSYFGYCGAIRRLTDFFPELEPLPLSACQQVNAQWKGDLVAMIGGGRDPYISCMELFPQEQYTADLQVVSEEETAGYDLPEEVSFVYHVRNPTGTGRVVIFHDSFGGQGWYRFFPLHFKETVFMLSLRPSIDTYRRVIEVFNPDVIINEQIHRNVLHKPQPVFEEWRKALER